MYLKRLETIGFKSFAERIEIEFVPGVTAVVGPNGSGKSNITDAIRWVLGEQSARSLRGMRMEDIIFQGSDTRRALNVAEVTLILDNSSHTLPIDYEEVSVTRRVYRSGESEFYLNNNPCRLKDIIDLFMDSGLGREAFSIIGQGRIEEILSSKADERRTIFEEAAGVLKYKQRKQQAEFKLSETEENLSRVEDIIYEIETQLEPVGKQREIALQYKEFQQQLKTNEISLLVTEIEQLHKEWTKILQKIEEQQNENIKSETIHQRKAALIEKEKSALEKLDYQIEDIQNKLVHLTEKLEQHDGQKNVMNERFKHLEESISKLKEELKLLSKNKEQIEELLIENESFLNSIQSEYEKKNKMLIETKHLLNMDESNVEEQLEQLEKEYISYLNKQAVYENKVEVLEANLKTTLKKSDQNKEQLNLFVFDKEQLEHKLHTLQSDIQEKQAAKLEYEQKASNLQQIKQEKTIEITQIEELLNTHLRNLASVKSREELLLDMEREMQGFFYGTKRILQAAKQKELTGIYGAVVNLIDIPSMYSDTFEAILGNTVQNIVTDNERSARAAIAWLKNNNIGRATFLPLDTVQKRQIQPALLKKAKEHPGFIDIASNLVDVESKFTNIVEFLMGNVIVAKDLKSANEIAHDVQRRYRIVTIDGDVVFPGGSMAGGSRRNQKSSLFTRDKELKQLKESRLKLERDIDKLKEQRDKITTEIEISENEYQGISEKLHGLVKKIEEMEKSRIEKQHIYQTAIERLELFNTDHKEFATNQITIQNEIEQINHEALEVDKYLKSLVKKRKKLEEIKEMSASHLREKELKSHELEKEIVQIIEKKNHLNNENKRLTEELQAVTSEISLKDEELAKLQDIDLFKQEQKEIIKKYEETLSDRENVTKEIQAMRKARYEKQQLISDEERELKASQKSLSQLAKIIQENEIQANRLDVALENRLSLLQEEYQITFEKAASLYERVEDIASTKAIVDQLKNKIDRLGPVNLGAIDEFERLKARNDFLTTQRDDLIEAKETLYEAIYEMDTKMKKLFSETFSQIQTEFFQVFKKLFGGGYAELQLTDEDNLLETGIEIIAQPPGKKLRNLSLLSGGERALTAIALLFAILHVRPVPFCVLDEVEAALDEANVTRFSQYLHKFSEETQFIVITHRKGTMEEADVLYGVTMEESGVSRLVSVRLSDAEELIQS